MAKKTLNKSDGEKALESTLRSIVTTLKKEGRYTPLLHLQAEHTATLLVITQKMRRELLGRDEPYVEEVISREGNVRAKQNPLYQLFAQYMDRLQDSLKALGMNVDSKPVKEKERGIDDFLDTLKS